MKVIRSDQAVSQSHASGHCLGGSGLWGSSGSIVKLPGTCDLPSIWCHPAPSTISTAWRPGARPARRQRTTPCSAESGPRCTRWRPPPLAQMRGAACPKTAMPTGQFRQSFCGGAMHFVVRRLPVNCGIPSIIDAKASIRRSAGHASRCSAQSGRVQLIPHTFDARRHADFREPI